MKGSFGSCVAILLASLYVVSAVRLVHVGRETTTEDIARPLQACLVKSGVDAPSLPAVVEAIEPLMDTYTESELDALLIAVRSETIPASTWVELWETANEEASVDSGKSVREIVFKGDSMSTVSDRPILTCSPKNYNKIIRKICRRNYFCYVFFRLVRDIELYLRSTGAWSVHAGGCGDPHMFGFDGSAFLFVGDLEHSFNVLSDKDFALQTRLTQAGEKEQMYFGAFEVTSGNLHISVEAGGESQKAIVTINDKQMLENTQMTQDGVAIQLTRMNYDNMAVAIATESYEVKIMGRLAHDAQHLDFEVQLVGKPVKPDGLLGVTIPGFEHSQVHPSKMNKAEIIDHFAV